MGRIGLDFQPQPRRGRERGGLGGRGLRRDTMGPQLEQSAKSVQKSKYLGDFAFCMEGKQISLEE